MDTIVNWVIGMFADHPTLQAVLIVIGILRAINKPLFSLINAYVESTPSKSDDEQWLKAKSSEWMKGLLYFLDWSTSIKVKKK